MVFALVEIIEVVAAVLLMVVLDGLAKVCGYRCCCVCRHRGHVCCHVCILVCRCGGVADVGAVFVAVLLWIDVAVVADIVA
jgi:hypothetical protein